MYLEEIVLDGFKSYAECTEINSLDPEFTAITGLNGSGKSNILDGICFVLGITSLQRIRVTSLTDLIYKEGEAGITKATVSLIFNNENVAVSPEGFENSPKIVISRTIFQNGTSKYLINNQTAKAKTLKQLFESVNMNINNPNFLIMEGRIQAILSMKPPQLLSLLEETAGTLLYEENRKEAVKTFDQKEAKLLQIEKIIKEDITPKIEKLEKERRIGVDIAYVEKAIGALEVIEEFQLIISCERRQEELEKDIEGARAKDVALKKALQELDNEYIQMNAELANLQSPSNRQDIQQFQGQIDQLEGELAVEEEKVELQLQKLEANQVAIKKKEKQIIELEGQLRESRDRIGALEGTETSAEEEHLEQLISQKKCQIGALNTELAIVRTGEADRNFLMQFMNKENQADLEQLGSKMFQEKDFLSVNEIYGRIEEEEIVVETEMEDLLRDRQENDNLVLRLQNEEIQARNNGLIEETAIRQEQQKINAEIQLLLKKYAIVSPQISDPESLKQFAIDLKTSIDEEKRQLNRARYAVEEDTKTRERQLSRVKELFMETLLKTFRVSSSIMNMVDSIEDKGRLGMLGTVLGMCNINRDLLSSMRADQTKLFKAIEIAAGPKLFNIIFNTEEEAASFVTSEECSERVTCLPIETIKGKELEQSQLEILQENKGFLLLDFLEPKNPDLIPIFQFLFGTTAIVSTIREAKNVAYDKNCALKCVTLEGDIVDPSGVVTGGSRRSQVEHSFLEGYLEYLDSEAEQIASFDEGSFDELEQTEKMYNQFQYSLAHYLGDMQEFNASSEQGKIERDISAAQARNEENSRKQSALERILSVISFVLEQITPRLSETSNRAINVIENDLNGLNVELERLQNDFAKIQSEAVANEIKELELRLQGDEEDLEVSVADLEAIEALRGQLESCLTNEQDKERQLSSSLESFMQQIRELIDENERQTSHGQHLAKATKELEERITRERDGFSRHLHVVKDLEDELLNASKELLEHGINVAEFATVFCSLFGGSCAFQGEKRAQISPELYEQELIDAKLCENASEAFQFVIEVVRSNKAAEMLSQREEQLEELHSAENGFSGTSANLEELQKSARQLVQMQQRLERDRQKIIAVIARVDEKKDQAVGAVYESVNESLGQIFSTLLPGATASLEQMGDGVEFSVELGSTKTTISGLSGGQKSLLALSFTLALLKFRPSPIYILDEIDAALDLSHTHNIGKIIQEEFGGSQFIIVSLKEGMFNHAKKLIKVRFSEGMSKIESK